MFYIRDAGIDPSLAFRPDQSSKRFRDATWWPKISQAVKDRVLSCSHYNYHQLSRYRETLITLPLPELLGRNLPRRYSASQRPQVKLQ